MAAHTGKTGQGMYRNGCGELGNDTNFSFTNWYTDDSFSADGCFAIDFDTTASWQSDDFIPVDTSKHYYHSVTARTLQRSGTSNRLAGGHMGFACYDKNKNFIDLRNCGGAGNTYLSRPASPGDSKIYLTSASGWYTGSNVTNNRGYFRYVLVFPADHPDYGTPHAYTRWNARSYSSLVQTDQGDWEMTLDSYRGSGTNIIQAATWPDYWGDGRTMPAGTPISRGQAGGTYNYCHGNPYLPETWTTYTTGVFTGESRNSSTPFRYGTKYIRFLNLANYNNRSDSGRPRPKFLLDNIMLVQAKPVKGDPTSYKTIKSTFFRREKIKWLKGKSRLKSFWELWKSR